MTDNLDWRGRWIWIEGDENPWNFYLCARRVFELDHEPREARLRITADTRYVVWVNGERLGQGPVRAWPSNYRYDIYDLRGILREGRNVVAVLVMHSGVATFQWLATRGGLLAEVEADGEVVAATDTSWKVHEHPGYSRSTPRITCQQGWVEQFNAFWEQAVWQNVELDEECAQKWRRGERIIRGTVDWRAEDFDDSGWGAAVEVGPAGCEPWTRLSPRDIPFLTEEPVYPVNVLRARTVREPQVWHVRLRETLLPGYVDANPMPICGLLATVVLSDEERDVTLLSPVEGNVSPGELRVNGEDVPWERRLGKPFDSGRFYRFRLRRGENLLVWDLTGEFHDWNFACTVVQGGPLTPVAAVLPPYPFLTYGPFDSREDPAFQGVWNARSASDLAPFEKHARQAFTVPEQPHLATAWGEETGVLATRQFAALASRGAEAAIIEPDERGDVEVLLDLGRMTLGYWELELDAHEGAVVDLLGFESIQDGALDLAWGINNTLRYTSRGGRQRYRSVVSRGARYFLLVLRDLKAPVTVHGVRVIQSTYPCVERGSFRCDDFLLNRIWEIGAYTTRLCAQDTYIDCPTYEQTFWVGDSRNEGAVNHWAFGEYALSRRCLLLAAESLQRSPLVESQVPSGWTNVLPTWSLLWALACEEYWRTTGDREFLQEIFPAIQRQNEYCLSRRDERGLVVLEGWNLLDWAPLDLPSGAPSLHIQGWFAMALERTAAMARELGVEEQAQKALAERELIIQAANRWFWNDGRKAYVDSLKEDGSQSQCVSQQSNTIALLSGIATGERADAIRPLLLDAPDGVVKVGSPFFMFFTFEALAKLGAYEDILKLTRRWWGMMLDAGSTTCWETFPGYEISGRYTRSQCHAWSAAPTYFQSRYQLGVAPLEPGFAAAEISPVPAGLKWALGRVPTPHGEISVSWRNGDGRFRLEAELPPGVRGLVRLPVPEGARYPVVEGCSPGRDERGAPVFEAAAGAKVTIEAEF